MKHFLTTNELAELLNVSTETIRRRTRDGTLQPVRLGSSVRYRLSDIQQMPERWSDEEISRAEFAVRSLENIPDISARQLVMAVMWAILRGEENTAREAVGA